MQHDLPVICYLDISDEDYKSDPSWSSINAQKAVVRVANAFQQYLPKTLNSGTKLFFVPTKNLRPVLLTDTDLDRVLYPSTENIYKKSLSFLDTLKQNGLKKAWVGGAYFGGFKGQPRYRYISNDKDFRYKYPHFLSRNLKVHENNSRPPHILEKIAFYGCCYVYLRLSDLAKIDYFITNATYPQVMPRWSNLKECVGEEGPYFFDTKGFDWEP